ncbi:MAG: hypothetical protein R2864_03480 [Syntrophotaleaceae bacterium]
MAETTKPNLIETIRQWPKSRQISLGVATALCLVFFSVLVMQARHVDYQLLFGNLEAGDAAAVVARLKEQKIAYRLESGGTAIYIPAKPGLRNPSRTGRFRPAARRRSRI